MTRKMGQGAVLSILGVSGQEGKGAVIQQPTALLTRVSWKENDFSEVPCFDLSVPAWLPALLREERLCLPLACLITADKLCVTKTVICKGDCLP